jgi:hypothetical protein
VPSVASPTISTFSVTKGGQVAETYACLREWDLSQSLDENLGRFKERNPIQAPTDAWLREMRRIFRVRFGDIEGHAPLIRLAQAGFNQDVWSQILIWHLCARELLLSDFLETWLYPRKQEGMLYVRSDNVRDYLASLRSRGLVEQEWTATTVSRMASGLPTYAADLGLLQGRAVKEFGAFHLYDEAFLYVLYTMWESTRAAEQVLGDRRWRWFLLSRADVEHELLRLHQAHKVRFEAAGSLVSLDLPHASLEAFVDDLVR